MYSELFKLHHRSFSLSFFSQVHMLHLVPQWQSAERHRKLKVMMQDRPDLIKSELAGLAFDSLQQVFRKADIDGLFTAQPLEFAKDQDVFVIIDPAAGGPTSDYAVVSLCRQRGIVTVRCNSRNQIPLCTKAQTRARKLGHHAIRYPCLHRSTNSGTGCEEQKKTVTSSCRRSRKKRASFAWFLSESIIFCLSVRSMFISRKKMPTLCACTARRA
jgi:hypothetical protein